MFHAGLALELSKIIRDDRRAEARAGRGRSRRGPSGRGPSGRAFFRMRQDRAHALGGSIAPLTAVEDPWWWWRVVEPDAEYLRRRAA